MLQELIKKETETTPTQNPVEVLKAELLVQVQARETAERRLAAQAKQISDITITMTKCIANSTALSVALITHRILLKKGQASLVAAVQANTADQARREENYDTLKQATASAAEAEDDIYNLEDDYEAEAQPLQRPVSRHGFHDEESADDDDEDNTKGLSSETNSIEKHSLQMIANANRSSLNLASPPLSSDEQLLLAAEKGQLIRANLEREDARRCLRARQSRRREPRPDFFFDNNDQGICATSSAAEPILATLRKLLCMPSSLDAVQILAWMQRQSNFLIDCFEGHAALKPVSSLDRRGRKSRKELDLGLRTLTLSQDLWADTQNQFVAAVTALDWRPCLVTQETDTLQVQSSNIASQDVQRDEEGEEGGEVGEILHLMLDAWHDSGDHDEDDHDSSIQDKGENDQDQVSSQDTEGPVQPSFDQVSAFDHDSSECESDLDEEDFEGEVKEQSHVGQSMTFVLPLRPHTPRHGL